MIDRQTTGRSYAIAVLFVLLALPLAAQNLVQNPNFTDEITPWRVSLWESAGFHRTVEGTGHSLVVSSTAPAGASSGSNGVFQRVPVSPGTQYRFGGNVRVIASCGSASVGTAYLSLTWRDANENSLGLPNVTTSSYHDAGTYQPSITVTAPANAALAGIALGIDTASQSTACTATVEYWGIELTPIGTVACAQSATNLCLSGGRFQVTAHWTTSDGKSGDGQAVRLTTDTGYFWFFNPANAEMTIKVLNACSFGGKYWVFAGGMTDVQVDITVTDTKTGVVRTYRNPLGTPFATITDTGAFATCP